MSRRIETRPIADLHDPLLDQRLRRLIDGKTKPLGALGRLETLALQLGGILRTVAPRLLAPQLLVFAADHGLAAHGTSAYPAEVTWQMVRNFLSGGAAVNVLARQHGLALTVVDCGVLQPSPPAEGLVDCRIAAGTHDALSGPAMSAAQCRQALDNGAELVRRLPGNTLLLGEMGIGNTSAAAMLLARIAELPIESCVGRGTGLDDAGLIRKIELLRQVLARDQREEREARDEHHAHDERGVRGEGESRGEPATEILRRLASLGGFEIATMVGAILQAALERRVIVVDGFITGAAVLVACACQPMVIQRCVFAHESAEIGHRAMLSHLAAEPLLNLGLRLGEGSGAALAWPLLESACRVLSEMASFESASVSVSGSSPASASDSASGSASGSASAAASASPPTDRPS